MPPIKKRLLWWTQTETHGHMQCNKLTHYDPIKIRNPLTPFAEFLLTHSLRILSHPLPHKKRKTKRSRRTRTACDGTKTTPTNNSKGNKTDLMIKTFPAIVGCLRRQNCIFFPLFQLSFPSRSPPILQSKSTPNTFMSPVHSCRGSSLFSASPQ